MRLGYTLAQCNAMLPLVRAISREVIERRHARRELLKERAQLDAARTPEGLEMAIADIEADVYEQEDSICAALRELEDRDLTVLRVNPLVVHFPGRTRDGEVVFCWQEGDTQVNHGHQQGHESDPRMPLKLKTS